jgi:myo-inositol-1(or 4)-monophosphatase
MNQYQVWMEEAAEIAERAGDLAFSFFRQALLIEMKENQTPVTNADKKTEELIRAELEQSFPTHDILGEEFGERKKGSRYVWTIDPIDGTRSFMRGIPLWGTLLALVENGDPVVGIMVMPALDETYVAAKGVGAYCNGVRLQVSTTTALESAFVSCGDLQAFEMCGKKDYYSKLMTTAGVARMYTDCFAHAMVMRGALDAMVDPIVSPWDVAPIACLIKEAGGEYFTLEGERSHEGTNFVTCATPELKAELLRLK